MKNTLFLALALASLTVVIAIQERWPQEPVKEKVSFKFNEAIPTFSSDGLKLVGFGYSRVISNLLWIRFLQLTPTEKTPAGELSWIYFDLDTITTIDPDFLPAFSRGGVFLSVITEDKVGAERLLLKGVQQFPQNWELHGNLGYHYWYELGQREKALHHYGIAASLPEAPPLMAALAARGMAEEGKIALGISFLENLRDSTTDEKLKEVYQDRINYWKKKKASGGSTHESGD